ncbi:MAG: ABC transporter ATP-binding protein [Burkholderiaceae bacterium]|nr:ABC transporter ATP-binding protein [Burkholderiaceae bacterium]
MNSVFAVEVINVSKRYELFERPAHRLLQGLWRGRRQFGREFWALRNVSFSILGGETLGIIGPNGSGKSTLLKMICGTVRPTAGRIAVQGRIAGLLELGAGFNAEFTGRENVYMSAHLHGMPRKSIEQKMASIAAFAEIGDFFDRPVKSYSSGMYVRLGFAVIAHLDADILVVDEALAVGDAYFVQKCMRFIRQFQKTGTIIFVSHDSGAIVSLCHRALWLDHGVVRGIGPAKDIAEAYLGDTIERLQGTGVGLPALVDAGRASHTVPEAPLEIEDAHDLVSSGSLMRGFRFDPSAPSFGKGGASVIDVQLKDATGAQLRAVRGGEVVTLSMSARLHEPMPQPILGFIVKDRLGQGLFSENTCERYAEAPVSADVGEVVSAHFTFRMPILPVGDYAITIAIADGTQFDHVQHHWIHDALIFKSITSSVSTGLVGIPMIAIDMVKG